MGNIFAASEIVELGIQIEKNGRDFYNALVKQAKDSNAREIFQHLADEEAKHILAFQKILDSTEKYTPAEAYPGEYFAYMNALASGHIFTQENKGAEIAKTIKSERVAVDTGIGFEKDSIIFYEGMKKVVPDYEHKVINELIAQEQRHLRDLTELKHKL